MRFLHLSDLHLGKRVNEFSMLEDQRYILDQMMKIFEEQKVDGVLIAGDVYDKTVPSAEAVQLFDEFITGLAKAEIPVYMISGNHDSAERLSFGAKLFESSDIYGLDISKIAIDMATRYRKDITWLVGNSKNIPIVDHSLDFICALFTVVNQDELKRALKEDGYIIHVTANNQHLIEIKELIYDEIKVKSDKYIRLDFNQVKSYDFKEKVHISNREDALNLLMMTPHYYHIKKEKRGVLDTLQGLDITIDIKVTVYALS